VYSRLPSVDWGFFARYHRETVIGLSLLTAAAIVGVIVYLEKGGESRARIMRGFAIFRDPGRLLRGLVVPQAISWGLRVASLFYFLQAFGVHASIHNALLTSSSTRSRRSSGDTGRSRHEAGLIVFLFKNEPISDSLLLAFSVGVNIAVVLFNLLLGAVALFLMARTFSWKKLRAAHAQDQAG